MDHPLGWRVTGTLKCSNCGTKTRHALLREDDKYRNSMERQQYVALGGMPQDDSEDVERLRRSTGRISPATRTCATSSTQQRRKKLARAVMRISRPASGT